MEDKEKTQRTAIQFWNRADKAMVNTLAQTQFTWLPRIGERVFLPGTIEGERMYRVVDVTFYFESKEISHEHGLIEFYRREHTPRRPTGRASTVGDFVGTLAVEEGGIRGERVLNSGASDPALT